MVEETVFAVTNEVCLKAKHFGSEPEDTADEKIIALVTRISISFEVTLLGKY